MKNRGATKGLRHEVLSDDSGALEPLRLEPIPDAAGGKGLKTAVIDGARSYALSRIVIEAANLGSVVVLARILGPAATGRAAVALVFPMLAVILTFEGFGSALVQTADVTREHLRTAMSLSLLSGVIFSSLLAALALTVGPDIFGVKTARLIALASPAFILTSPGCVSRALLMRDLRFRLMSRRDSATIVLGSAATVVLALLGFGPSCYVWATLLATGLDTIVMIASAPPAGIGWDRAAAREIAAYGSHASASGLVATLRGNVDFIILGAIARSRVTGIYYRAFQFGAVYQGKVSSVFVSMLFPVMSRSQSDEDLKRVRQRSASLNALVSLPLLALVVALAPQLVLLLYGSKWGAAVLPTQILSGVGMVNALGIGSFAVPLALGRTDLLFKVQLLFLIMYGVAILAAAHFGLTCVCCTAFGTYMIMLLIEQRVLIDNLLGLPVTQLLKDTGPAIAGSAICIGASALTASLCAGLPAIVIVLIASPAGLVAYLLSLRWAFPRAWRETSGLARSFARGTA